jgi:AcrR family transcriptional regulator
MTVRDPRRRPARERLRRDRHLSREAIIEAAIRVLDAEGVDAVTMRRVAEELHTGPASLYAHIDAKDELLAAIYDQVMSSVDVSDIKPSAARWQSQIKEFMRRFRRVLLEHRDLAPDLLAQYLTASTYEHYLWREQAVNEADMAGFHQELQEYFESLPASEYPTLHKLAPLLVQADESEDTRFEFGLDILVKGIAAHARK